MTNQAIFYPIKAAMADHVTVTLIGCNSGISCANDITLVGGDATIAYVNNITATGGGNAIWIPGVSVENVPSGIMLKPLPKPFEYPDRINEDVKVKNDDLACIICADNERKTINLPCMHICCCFTCAKYAGQKMGEKVCPVCRSLLKAIKLFSMM